MKILYITSLFLRKASSASIRNVSLVNGLIQNGVEVDVLTLGWPESLLDDYLEMILSDEVSVFSDDLKILNQYLNSKESKSSIVKNKFIKKIKNFIRDILFFPDVDKEWINIFNKNLQYSDYDLIISSSDTKTSHFVAKKIKKEYNIRWFQIWGDPWAEDINLNGLRKIRAKWNEKNLLKLADKSFYVSLPTLQTMKNLNPKLKNKLNYLPRGYLKKVNGRERKEDNDYIFSYTGSLSYGRSIMPLIKEIEKFNKTNKDNIILNIYGGADKKILNGKNYEFINFKGTVNFKKIIDVYKNSDCLIFLGNCKGAHQIPGKLYDYFGTDRTILCLLEEMDSKVSQFIKETNRCIIYKNEYNKINLNSVVNDINSKNNNIMDKYSGAQIAQKLLSHYKS